jgi:hypothetical protein
MAGKQQLTSARTAPRLLQPRRRVLRWRAECEEIRKYDVVDDGGLKRKNTRCSNPKSDMIPYDVNDLPGPG